MRDRLTRGLDAAQKKLKSFGKSAAKIGAGLMGAGAAIAGPLALATQVFASFDGKMANVAAITGSTSEQMDQLRARAKELGSTTKFSASEAAEAMKFLGMAGYDTTQILAGIGPVLQLAAAGGLELGTAADIASDVSSAFGLTADEIGRVADVIAKAATSSNTSVEMMGETFKYAAPLAAAAGQSIEDMAAAVGVLANSGVKASVAGTDLALILKKMGDSATVKKLAKLGVATADAEGNLRSMVDVMEDVAVATQDMTEQQRLETFSSIFDRATKSALIMAGSGDGFRELAGAMQEAGGSAAKMSEVMQDSLAGDATKIRSALEGVGIAIVEALKAPLRSVASALASVLGTMTRVIEKNPALVKGIAIAAGVLTVAGAALVGFGAAAVLASVAVGALSTLVGLLASPVALVVGGIAVLSGGLLTAGAAAIYFSGVGGKAVDWIKDKFGQLKSFVAPILQGISDALASGNMALAAKIGFAGVRLAFWTGLQMLPGAVSSATKKMTSLFIEFFGWVLGAANAVSEGISKALAAGLKMDTKEAGFALLRIAQNIGKGIAGEDGKAFESQRKAAEADLKRLTAEAAAGRPDAPGGDEEPPEIEVNVDLDEALKAAGATGEQLDRVTNSGTFSGFAAGRIGGQGGQLQERIAAATERTAAAAEGTKAAIENLETGTYEE